MFLSQARLTRGLHVVAVADLNVERARSQLATAGWPAEQFAASSLDDALKKRATHVTADAESLIKHPGIEVIVEATGIPEAGIVHALKAIEHGKHIVMVNVEADALAGPVARAQGEGRGRGLQPRLGRSAGAHLRARRLGARLRASRWSRPARARATSRTITAPIPTMSGTSSTST